MKKQMFFLFASFFLAALTLNAQLTKFQKWQKPSYFTGFNIKLWDNVELRTVNQQDFYDLAATAANLAMIQAWGTRNDTFPYGRSIWWTNGIDTSYRIDKLDNMVSYARNAGLHYVLCIRKGPGRQDVGWPLTKANTLWTDSLEQNLYAGMLKDMVQRYLPDSLFVGLDMILEPNPGPDAWANLTPYEYEDSLKFYNINVNKIYKKCIDSIRLVAPDLPLLVEGVRWSNAEFFATTEKQADDKIVYNTRGYIPSGFLREETMNNPNLHYPDNYWCWRLDRWAYFDKTFLKDTLFYLVDSFQQANDVPIIVGEFGLSKPQLDGMTYLREMAEIYCEKGWHYTYWIFRGEPGFNYEYFDDSLMLGTTSYMDTVIQTLNCETPLDIEEVFAQPNLYFYPNPFEDFILMPYLLEDVNYEVLSLDGKLVKRGKSKAGRISDLKDLKMGIYVIKFNGSSFVGSKRLIKCN